MRVSDLMFWLWRALLAGRSRSLLSALGIAIGIASVTLLTGIGEGIRLYMLDSFSQFGTRLITVTPGKTETGGGPAGILSSSRPLLLEDANGLARLPSVEAALPVVQGQGEVRSHGLTRSTAIMGTGSAALAGWRLHLAQGRFLPADDSAMPRAYAVLGSKVATELFPNGDAPGSLLRAGDRRFRVAGVLAPKGQFLNFDFDDMIYLPAAHAQALFNKEGLQEINVIYRAQSSQSEIIAQIKRLLIARHGSEDFTLTSQQDMLTSLDKILSIIKLAVGGLGVISLLIGAVGIFSIMSIAQQERVPEVGLLMALGCPRRRILLLFLLEAMVLALLGGAMGLALLGAVTLLVNLFAQGFPLTLHPLYLLLALGCSALVGLLAGVAPALRAVRLDPVVALRGD
ncbi:MAG: ABC transporter permease [Aeromonas sp.]